MTLATQTDTPLHVSAGMNMLRTIAQHGDWPMAIEAVSAIALVDIQKRQQQHLKTIENAADLGDVYFKVLTAAGLRPAPRVVPADVLSRRVRVLISTFALSDGQSASTSIARWVELFDQEQFELQVLVADELTERTPPLRILKRPEPTSLVAGCQLIERVTNAGVRVECVSTHGTLLDGAQDALGKARAFQPDVLLSVASPACPIQAALIAARVAPLQIVMNIGVPLILPGVDAIIYHNDAKAEEDVAFLATRGIEQHRVITIGTDLRQCEASVPASRADLGIPEDAVLLLGVGNVLPKRLMFAGFGRALARFLAEHPHCWYAAVGKGDFDEPMDVFRDAGVSDRVRVLGAAEEPRSVMKAADILLNEYPEGGGNTVLEAMGCGLPVVAMHAGRGHAERIGALLAGEDAIPTLDPDAYWNRVRLLATDAAARHAAAQRALARARAHFDYAPIVQQYQRIILSELATHADAIAGRGF